MWTFLFSVNDLTLKHRGFSKFCWDVIKCELFYVGGGCKHSGYCCTHLKIKFNNVVIQNDVQFHEMASSHSVLKRFIPVFFQDQKKINYFTCSSLGSNNFCNDYETRPNFCRNYPYNIFLEYDYIRQGCGYFVRLKREFFPKNRRLQKLIKKVYLLNAL